MSEPNMNKWTLRREVTVGDLLTIFLIGGPLIVAAIHLSDRVDQHEERLQTHQLLLNEHSQKLGMHDTAIAVLQSKEGVK